jgi:hypothetical protein
MALPYEQWRCGLRGCGKGPEAGLGPINEEYSLGIYAGRYHARCWDRSGYRKEGPEGFDPMDAGEAYWEDDY